MVGVRAARRRACPTARHLSAGAGACASAGAPCRPAPPPAIDLAAFGSVVHDGDVGTWAAGGELAFGLGDRFSLTAQGHATGERTQPLGPGQAAYQSLGFGAGVSWRRPLGRTLLLDAGAGPEALRTALRGEKLSTPRDATAWSLAIDARIRLGVRLGPVSPSSTAARRTR